MPRQGGPGGAGLRPHQPGADRCRRSCCARSGTAPVPQRQSHAQPLLEAAEPGQARARRAGRRGPCPPRYPAVVLFLRKGRPAAVPSWPAGRTRWITVVPGAGTPAAAARRTLTATAGRVMSITDPASSRTGSRRRRPGPSGCAGMMPAIPGSWRPGRSACSCGRASSTARRRNPGGLGAGISDFPRAAIAVAPDGGPGKAGELRLLEWEVAAPQ